MDENKENTEDNQLIQLGMLLQKKNERDVLFLEVCVSAGISIVVGVIFLLTMNRFPSLWFVGHIFESASAITAITLINWIGATRKYSKMSKR